MPRSNSQSESSASGREIATTSVPTSDGTLQTTESRAEDQREQNQQPPQQQVKLKSE